jgi:hypothetical protein
VGENYVLRSTLMDPDSKPNGLKDKEGAGTHAEFGRWEIAGGNGCLWDISLLLYRCGDLDEERSCDVGNVLTGHEVKCSARSMMVLERLLMSALLGDGGSAT